MNEPIPCIAIHTRAILGGEFMYYPAVKHTMLRRYPELSEFLDSMDELSDRVDLDRYVRESVIPSVSESCTLANCKEWLFLMRTKVVGAY